MQLKEKIRAHAISLGFNGIGFTPVKIDVEKKYVTVWLDKGFHGSMQYMEKNYEKLLDPKKIAPWAKTIISLRLNYFNINDDPLKNLNDDEMAYIARYALGRDYHRVFKSKLKKLSDYILSLSKHSAFKTAVDSTPILEKTFAEKAGLGWIGKNTNLINKHAGSFFLIGEIISNLEIDQDKKATNHCGSCMKCIDICPTNAFDGPYSLDARKCISYLTIENKGEIPKQYRSKLGNRIFGCDDCQIFCPWNKFAEFNKEDDFKPRHNLDGSKMTELFLWDYETWSRNTEGSAIRRAGYVGWLRNLAIGIGNSKKDKQLKLSILDRQKGHSELLDEHIHWSQAQLSEIKE